MASTPRSLPPRRSTTPAKQDGSAGTTTEPRQQQQPQQQTTTRATTTTATTTRHRITVDIPQRPRYVPGKGPPLHPVSLVPPADSTAYVVDRILLPPAALAPGGNHPRPRRMTYLLGWTDLPAARLLVPALRVLDYVSPRALEAYEEGLEEELEADMARLEEEKKVEESLELQQQQEQQQQDLQEDAVGDGALSKKKKRKKKRGRPPKHTQIEAAAVADLEAGDDKASWLTGGAMALSTPRKDRTRRDFEGLSEDDEGEEDDEGSPSRQLAREEAQGLSREGSSEHRRQDGDVGTGWGGGGGLYGESGPGGDNAQLSSLWGLSGGDSLSLFAAGEPLPPPTKSNKRKTPPQSSGADGTAAFPPTSKPKKSAKSAKPKPQPEPEPETAAADDGEEVWVVKRILDCDVYEAEGRGRVRYFRVLWEGDWPPEQNPSWEPEENLPRQLVRNYFKTSKARRLRMQQRHAGVRAEPSLSPPKKKKKEKKEVKREQKVKAAPLGKLKQSKLSWGAAAATAGPRYSSVSEAFTGSPDDGDEDDYGYGEDGYGEDELMTDRFELGARGESNGARAGDEDSSPGANDDDGDDGDGDELFVVDEEHRATKTPSGVGWFGGGAGNQLFGSRVFI